MLMLKVMFSLVVLEENLIIAKSSQFYFVEVIDRASFFKKSCCSLTNNAQREILSC